MFALVFLPHGFKIFQIGFFFLFPWASAHPPWRSLPTRPPQKFRPCIWIMPGQALSELRSKHWPHLARLCAKRSPLTLSSDGLSSHLPTGLEPSSLADALETLTSSCLLSSLVCSLLACCGCCRCCRVVVSWCPSFVRVVVFVVFNGARVAVAAAIAPPHPSHRSLSPLAAPLDAPPHPSHRSLSPLAAPLDAPPSHPALRHGKRSGALSLLLPRPARPPERVGFR